MPTMNRRLALKTLTASLGVPFFSPAIRQAKAAASEPVDAEWIVRAGETVKLPPGWYRRVILDGGRLEAPSDVCIEELVFHAGAVAMPVRTGLKA